jgi:uncharacterized membrane protein YuzA (DUF378 family)
MLQEIIAYILLGIAVVFLIRKFLWKKSKSKSCGPDDCDCH